MGFLSVRCQKVTLDLRDSRELFQNIPVLLFLWCENTVGDVWLGVGTKVVILNYDFGYKR